MPSSVQAPVAMLVFFGGKAEEQEAANAERGAGFGFLHGFVDGEVEDAGHGGDLAADAFAFAEEERVDRARRGAGVFRARANAAQVSSAGAAAVSRESS